MPPRSRRARAIDCYFWGQAGPRKRPLIFSSTFHASKTALREARGNILPEKFTRSLNVCLPHGEYKFHSDAKETSSSRAVRGIFPRCLRKSRESRPETTASATV